MEKKYKYINKLSEDVAEMRIYKRIGIDLDDSGYFVDGVNGSDFASEMAWLQDKCKKINVRINSGGGSVIDGYAIVASILNSKVPVDTYIDGLAASMAAVIAVCGKKVYMADYGVFMIHNVSGAEDSIANKFSETINTILAGRTGNTTEAVAEMMSKETWMNAEEALNGKFIDEIVNTSNKKKATVKNDVNELYAYFNEIINPKINMKQIANTLKLAENVSEVEVVNAINAKDAQIAELQNKINALEAEKTEAENKRKEALKNKATELVNKAVEAKKIEAAEVAELVNTASESEEKFALVEKMLSKINNVNKAVRILENKAGAPDEKANWTWTDWSKKDPKGLENMLKTQPEVYNELYNKEFKK